MRAREAARANAAATAQRLSDTDLAALLEELADDIEAEAGRAYAPAMMREAARRLAARGKEATP